MRKNWRKLLCAAALALAVGLNVSVSPAAPPVSRAADPSIAEAHTKPSEQRQLSFPTPGVIKQLAIKEGDVVKQGDLLMAQDDEIEAAEMRRLDGEAKSDARIIYYRLAMDLKQKVLDRKTKAGKDVFNESEIQEAEADFRQAEQQIKVSELDHAGEVIKADQQRLKLDRMKLKSPFDGIVERVGIREGEFATPDREKPALLVVKNDPCYIEILSLWSWQVAKLTKNETMQVKYVGETEWRTAKIVYIASVADQKTDVQTVRLELPNPEKRPTGLPIQVKIPAKLLEGNGVAASR